MMNLKNSVSIASLGAALAFGAPAEAVIVSYDATITYELDVSGDVGNLLFRLSYDDQAADTDVISNSGTFPVLSFEITDLTGGLGFGSVSSASGDTGGIFQISTSFSFFIDTSTGDQALLLGNAGGLAIADPNSLIQFDLNDLTFGNAYGSFIGSDNVFEFERWTPTQVVTNVPLPSSLALMSLVAGGAAIRAAAKSRRAVKRAKTA